MAGTSAELATQYATALLSSHHPSHLRDGIDHEMAFSALVPVAAAYPNSDSVLRSELAALWRRDIPLFRFQADQIDALDCQGNVIKDVFAKSGFDDLIDRIDGLEESGAKRDCDSIRLAFSAVKSAGHPHPDAKPSVAAPRDQNAVVEAAAGIADTLMRRVHFVEGAPFWVSAKTISDNSAATYVTAYDLYSGSAGIGIFFAEMFKKTGDCRHEHMARACQKTIQQALGSGANGIGAFSGDAGLLFADLCIGRVIDGSLAPHLVKKYLSRIGNYLDNDTHYDVIGGSAGVLLVAREFCEVPEVAGLALAIVKSSAERLSDGSYLLVTGARIADRDGNLIDSPIRPDVELAGAVRALEIADWFRREGCEALPA